MYPRLYHAHHCRHMEDLDFWLSLAKEQGGPILEMGCGTGRILAALAKAGFQTFGLDYDLEMLRFLQNNSRRSTDPTPMILQANMIRFHLKRRFPLVILPCNTISLLSAEERQQTFQQVTRHLSQNGLFATSLPNPAMLATQPRRGAEEVEEIFDHPVDGNPVQVSSAWKCSSRHFTLTWHYDHLLPDGQVNRLSRHAQHSLEGIESYRADLEAAGMTMHAVFGDFDRSAYTEESPYLILMAELGSKN